MIDPPPERGITHTHVRASNRAMLVIAASGLTLLATACTTGLFTDSEPRTASDPPHPRNDCERAFLSELTANIGIAYTPPARPETDAVVGVMNHCEAPELLAADSYFRFSVGETNFNRLGYMRLFNGPERHAQLVELCRSEPYDTTLSCQTLEATGR